MTLIAEIWRLLAPAQRRRLIAAQALSVAMAFSTVTGIAAIAPFFAVLGEPRLIDRNSELHWLYVQGRFSSEHRFVIALGLGFIGVALLANLVNAIGGAAMHRLALRIGAEWQAALFDEYLGRPYAFHASTHGTTLFNNIVHETARVTNGILQNILVLVTNLVTVAFIAVSVVLLNSALSLGMLAGLAGVYVVIYVCMRSRLLRLGHEHSRAWAQQTKIVSESFGAIREILLLQDRRLFQGIFKRASREVADAGTHVHAAAQVPKHVIESAALIALVGMALLVIARDQGMGPWLGQLTLIAFSAYRLLPMLQQIFAAAVRIRADRAALERVAPDLAGFPAARLAALEGDRSGAAQGWRHGPHDHIRLNEVSFRYGPDRGRALIGVDLCIAARSMVGIVGANGSGKTTLMDLLAGLLTPTSGELVVDGVSVDDGNRIDWQRCIAYVPQHVFLLDSTIAENIAFGIAPQAVDASRLRRAARAAQLEEVILSLPDGYDHKVGERGIRLSGGQRQRIGIARALYKEASVLLLDEATSALDGMTELELMNVLDTLRGRATIVLIAHRFGFLRGCDAIFQLEMGKVIGRGSYHELTRGSERFRRMS